MRLRDHSRSLKGDKGGVEQKIGVHWEAFGILGPDHHHWDIVSIGSSHT